MSMDGWIKLHRKISENPIWTSEKFTRGQAWVDLILLANHDRGFFYCRDHKIEVDRGDVGWSALKLSTRWKWSRSKVVRFLNDLEKEQQIRQQKSKSYSIITIINYDQYQKNEHQGKQQKSISRASEKHQANTNKNDKNDKNDKKKNIGKKFIPPTEQDVVKFFIENNYSESSAKKAFSYYNEGNWKDSRGQPVKNWKQKMRGVWFKDNNKTSRGDSHNGFSSKKYTSTPDEEVGW